MEAELQKFWAKALEKVTRASADKKHPFRNCVLATVYKEKVNQRTVVHRKFLRKNTSIIFTDSRSKKVMQLEGNPISSLLFYDPKKKLQISVAGLMKIHDGDDIADEAKDSIQDFSDYNNAPFPGAAIEQSNNYSKGETNFMVLEFHWLEVDVLELSREGHRRAIMRRDNDSWNGTWVVP